ncbi:MAG TPA: autotransporter outer membrane beta-barrel domain-containing protein [Ignavibacteriales bacterium]|nr:autotransporter outer membrane beta-barrel domain-containing protein [Ignavibacteriales bacterium]
MKKYLFLILCLTMIIAAQEGRYYRKTITSLGGVLFASKPNDEIAAMINNRIKQHIHIERFDYLVLSNEYLKDFYSTVNKTNFTPDEIIKALENTVLSELKLKLDEVKEIRAAANLTEEQKARAIVDKMKQSGIDEKDILAVYNASYLYLPVILSFDEKEKDNNYTFTITGFILWFKVNTKDANNFSITLVNKTPIAQMGMETAEPNNTYPIKNRSIDGKTYAKLMACNTLVRNWAVDMKKIPEFSLAGQIVNVDKQIEANIGTKEGVGLDDGYTVLDYFENDNGEIVKKEVGFVRANKIGDNTKEGYNPTYFKPYIGKNFERGQYLSERPNLGIDVGFRLKWAGLNISSQDFPFLKDDVKGSFGADILFSYNLAKKTGISQFFVNLEAYAGLLAADVKNDALYSNSDISNFYTYSIYLSFSKKFWMGRNNLELGAGYGYNAVSFKYSYDYLLISNEYEYDFKALGLKFDVSYNYLVNPELQIGLYAGYKLTTNITEADIKDKDGNKSTFAIHDSHTNFKGLSFGLQLNYAVPTLPIDPFSVMTAQDINY